MKEKLLKLPPETKIPNHIAIIPDGNRRWAKKHGLPTFEGHRRGAQVMPKILRACRDLGIHTATIWGFSTENWKRRSAEIEFIMQLVGEFIDKYLQEAKKENVRIAHIGRKDRISKQLREKIIRAEQETKNNTHYIFNAAFDYGGHDEILRATQRIFQDVQQGKIKINQLTEEQYNNYLDTAGQPFPFPDIIIRTSGEKRVSGLYSWQGAYSEFYWEPCYFPDYTPEKLREAILDYSGRERRFGGNNTP